MDGEENLIRIPTAAELGIKPDNGGEMPGGVYDAAGRAATTKKRNCEQCRLRRSCLVEGGRVWSRCPEAREVESRLWWARDMPRYAEAQEPRFHPISEKGASVNEPDKPVKSLRGNFFMV